jgi:UDPglucose--hexose-1-phosphate uridylyltransferase
VIDWMDHPHRRFNPLNGRWVLVSARRSERPWQGQIESASVDQRASYDPACYLCPGNARAGGVRNPGYGSTFVFDNDFPALRQDTPAGVFNPDLFNQSSADNHKSSGDHGLLRAESETGVCRVVCFSPRHDLTLARMDVPSIASVVDTWCDQYRALGELPAIGHVQIFENRGEMMGASNSHPHCQIWATSTVPDEVAIETANQLAYQHEHGSCLLCDYLSLEKSPGTLEKNSGRLVCENEAFAALVPFWAVWPFEVIAIAKRHVTGLDQFDARERLALAEILSQITIRYDNLFETPFPYSMGLHQRPTDSSAHPQWHFHAHFYPPLLRSATVRKFMVGFELLAIPQRDLTAEQAAARLRALPAVHYLQAR